VVAQLGGGSSLCALADFASVECSMGYSPLDGLPMATRCGALDPGVLLELVGPRGMPPDAVSRLLYRESGLLGVSGRSADLRELLASEAPEARQAIDVYVHHLVRGIGAMAATLGGLDALVFSGGIGEHAAPIRAAACARLGFLGVAIDPAANAAHAPVLEAADSRVAVRIVACDEEAEMAREAFALVDGATRD
jgi:acetate kinase